MVGYNVPPRGMVSEKSQDHKQWAGYSKESNIEELRNPQRDPGQLRQNTHTKCKQKAPWKQGDGTYSMTSPQFLRTANPTAVPVR